LTGQDRLFSSIFNITTDYLPVLSGRNAGNRVFKNHLDAKGCCTDFLFGVVAFLIAGHGCHDSVFLILYF
jgi:hypothetical protein